MAISNQEKSDKLSQAKANLERSKNRLQRIKAEVNSFDLTQSVNMAVINEELNKENSQPIQLSTAAKEFTNISYDQELSGILNEIWNNPNIQGVRSTKGSSFWFEIKSPGIPK